MATEVPNKYYKYSVNGREYTQATPGGISDPSYKEMSLQEYQQANPGYQPVSSSICLSTMP